MPWETRHGSCRYFYVLTRRNSRTARRYVGKGPTARIAEELEERIRRERQRAKDAWAAERRQIEAADQQLHTFRKGVQAFVETTLVVAGFHQHRGDWRQRRLPKGRNHEPNS